MTISDFPAINASLNGTSAVLLGFGFYFIRRKQVPAHKRCMIAAFVVSAIFLGCYVSYHYLLFHRYHQGPTRFTGQGWVRPLYFSILLTHTILAMVIVPMILVTLYKALRGRFESHRRIARWTWPLWLYVSVTGVVVYWMLYHLYPAAR